ncbi:hypothetical protein OGATHE_004424 [Ogataea polymorpha]|uniref:Uncharacterized protein n=1 Tax=Ogataea polymorpha TaxID=460523 RepID=A0A9P8NZM8_9ASCO|nr:hypothetical protein OGATHE_004424 [Ogataea polymorpha]
MLSKDDNLLGVPSLVHRFIARVNTSPTSEPSTTTPFSLHFAFILSSEHKPSMSSSLNFGCVVIRSHICEHFIRFLDVSGTASSLSLSSTDTPGVIRGTVPLSEFKLFTVSCCCCCCGLAKNSLSGSSFDSSVINPCSGSASVVTGNSFSIAEKAKSLGEKAEGFTWSNTKEVS